MIAEALERGFDNVLCDLTRQQMSGRNTVGARRSPPLLRDRVDHLFVLVSYGVQIQATTLLCGSRSDSSSLFHFQVFRSQDTISIRDVQDVFTSPLHLAHVGQQLEQVATDQILPATVSARAGALDAAVVVVVVALLMLQFFEPLADGGQPKICLVAELVQSTRMSGEHEDLTVQVVLDPPVALNDAFSLVAKGIRFGFQVIFRGPQKRDEFDVSLCEIRV